MGSGNQRSYPATEMEDKHRKCYFSEHRLAHFTRISLHLVCPQISFTKQSLYYCSMHTNFTPISQQHPCQVPRYFPRVSSHVSHNFHNFAQLFNSIFTQKFTPISITISRTTTSLNSFTHICFNPISLQC